MKSTRRCEYYPNCEWNTEIGTNVVSYNEDNKHVTKTKNVSAWDAKTLQKIRLLYFKYKLL